MSGERESIPRRFYISPSRTNLLLKRNPPLGLGCDMLHLDKNASAEKLSRIVAEVSTHNMRVKPKFLGFISIIAGSRSDERVVKDVLSVLKKEKVKKEVRYISAHRQLKELEKYIREAGSRVDVYICIAGLSAALPGIVASLTDKPVIAVPVNVKLEGLDALLSSLEMPSGVPVATVGIDNGKNAAYLALRILRLKRINSNGKENGK